MASSGLPANAQERASNAPQSTPVERRDPASSTLAPIEPRSLSDQAQSPIEDTPIGTEAATLGQPINRGPPSRLRLPAEQTFRVATWNLAAAKPGETVAQTAAQSEPKPTWRHTFGSERGAASARHRHKQAGFEADIIALQGITNLPDIHRLFNARTFHVIASRQLLARSGTNSSGLSVLRSDTPPTTAIAYRRRRGVKIAGVRHFLPRRAKPGAQEPAAITAMRLRTYRKMVWYASLDIPATCEDVASNENTAEPPTCDATRYVLAKFTDWATQRRQRQSEPVVLLGQWPENLRTKLEASGLSNQMSAPIQGHCSPAPSDVLTVMAPKNTTVVSLEVQASAQQPLSFKEMEKTSATHCAGLTQLTLSLR